MSDANIKTVTISIRERFKYSNAVEKEMMVQVARLCVLYENFMLEVRETLAAHNSPKSERQRQRSLYFGFRVLATVWEMKQAVDVLNRNAAFKKRRKTFEPDHEAPWDKANKFFQANKAILKTFRNDYAGHFTDDAARFGIENMPSTLQGRLVVTYKTNGSLLEMPFAGQIFAVGVTKDRPQNEDYETFLGGTFKLIVEAQKHALNVAHIIADQFFLKP